LTIYYFNKRVLLMT